MAVNFSLWINPDLKDAWLKYCEKRQFVSYKVVNLFAEGFIENKDVSFLLELLNEKPVFRGKNTVKMSVLTDADTKEQFDAACKECGWSSSAVLRGFMDYCVRNNCSRTKLKCFFD